MSDFLAWNRRLYSGHRPMTKDGVAENAVVSVKTGLNPRRDLVDHSPTGFEWGYGGSGPAQLALALASDALLYRRFSPLGKPDGHELCGPDVQAAEQRAIEVHQALKEMLVARFEHSAFAVTQAAVLGLIDEILIARSKR